MDFFLTVLNCKIILWWKLGFSQKLLIRLGAKIKLPLLCTAEPEYVWKKLIQPKLKNARKTWYGYQIYMRYSKHMVIWRNDKSKRLSMSCIAYLSPEIRILMDWMIDRQTNERTKPKLYPSAFGQRWSSWLSMIDTISLNSLNFR